MSVNRGNVGRATSCVATGGRRDVGVGGGEGRLFGNASRTGRTFCRYDYRGGPEREVRVDNRTYQVLITKRRLASVQVKSHGFYMK